MNCQEFEELSGAYVLGAVTSEERQEAEEHLAGCPKCQHLLRGLQSVVGVLPLTAPVAAPPPELKERIFASIRATRTDLPPAVVDMPNQLPAARYRRWWSTRIATAVAAVMFVLLAVMVTWNIALQQQLAHVTPCAPTIMTSSIIQDTTTVPGKRGHNK
jgi:anti-sigma-K factor RskA